MSLFRSARLCLVVGGLALATGGLAHANTLSVTYFEVSASDPSYGTMCCSASSDEVLSTLGPNGLPLLNPSYSGPMPNSADVVDGQLTWWSPSLNSNVTQTGTGTVTLPFNTPSDFFPPTGNGSNDYSGGLTAIFSGTIDVPTTELISFSVGADDSVFAYLDGNNVCDLGGVHALTVGTCTTPFDIAAGSHSFELFYDDMDPVQAGLTFDVTTSGVTTSGVPEPGTFALLGAGLLGLGLVGMARRRRAGSASR